MPAVPARARAQRRGCGRARPDRRGRGRSRRVRRGRGLGWCGVRGRRRLGEARRIDGRVEAGEVDDRGAAGGLSLDAGGLGRAGRCCRRHCPEGDAADEGGAACQLASGPFRHAGPFSKGSGPCARRSGCRRAGKAAGARVHTHQRDGPKNGVAARAGGSEAGPNPTRVLCLVAQHIDNIRNGNATSGLVMLVTYACWREQLPRSGQLPPRAERAGFEPAVGSTPTPH